VKQLGDYIEEGELDPAPDLAQALAEEFAMRVEEELAEGRL
jgi:hypothetical protein